MFKSNKGFTLVELIVVIAILAILAGVAIPVYNGYIKRAQDASVVTELDAIATAAQAANATEGGIDLIVVSADGKSIKVSGAEDNTVSKSFNDDFILFYGKAGVTAVSGKYGQFTISEAEKIDMAGSYTDKGANWTENDGWKTGVANIDDNKIPGETQPSGSNPPAEEEPEGEDPNHTHSYTSQVIPATCESGAVTRYTCSCNDSYDEPVEGSEAVACSQWDADGYCVVCGTHKSEINNTGK